MSFEDWIFSIHLLFAATLVGSLVMSWIVVVSMRTADTPDATLSLHRVGMVATGATIIVNDTGIYIQNGKGASLVMAGPSVTINNGALVVI